MLGLQIYMLYRFENTCIIVRLELIKIKKEALLHIQEYCVLLVKYIYMSAQEEDNAGTAGVLMGGGNNYSSGLFQLLSGVFWE